MLALRLNLVGSPTFHEVLARVRQVALAAYAHQDVPFEKLVEELQPERNLSHNPLFQVMFSVQNVVTDSLKLSGLKSRQFKLDNETVKCDLMLLMTDADQGLIGSVAYNADLFDTSTISRMVAHYERLLTSIVSNPNQRVRALPIMSEGERQQLVEWNDTARAYPSAACIHELFEAQVERTPE